MAVRTIYVLVETRKGRPLGVAALRTLAANLRRLSPPPRYSDTYISGGTRFDVLEPDAEVHVSSPVLKVRGDDAYRSRALLLAAATHRIVAVAGHDRRPIGGRR